ncbi:hypothetical protein [Novipirellula sp.]|uniref:hypothetical protein n=1 Tax=Novipirellula sp. TaxID=2795430 RepID=UPI00356B0D86
MATNYRQKNGWQKNEGRKTGDFLSGSPIFLSHHFFLSIHYQSNQRTKFWGIPTRGIDPKIPESACSDVKKSLTPHETTEILVRQKNFKSRSTG